MPLPSLLKGSIKNAVKKLVGISQSDPDTPLTNSLQVDSLCENLRKMLEESLQLGVSFSEVVECIKDKKQFFGDYESSLDSTLVMIQVTLNNNKFVDFLQEISNIDKLSTFYQQRSFFFSEEEMTFLTALFIQLKSLTFKITPDEPKKKKKKIKKKDLNSQEDVIKVKKNKKKKTVEIENPSMTSSPFHQKKEEHATQLENVASVDSFTIEPIEENQEEKLTTPTLLDLVVEQDTLPDTSSVSSQDDSLRGTKSLTKSTSFRSNLDQLESPKKNELRSNSVTNSPKQSLSQKSETKIHSLQRVNSKKFDEIDSPSPIPAAESDLMEKRKRDIEEKKRLIALKKKEMNEKKKKTSLSLTSSTASLDEISDKPEEVEEPKIEKKEIEETSLIEELKPLETETPTETVNQVDEKKVKFDPIVTLIDEEKEIKNDVENMVENEDEKDDVVTDDNQEEDDEEEPIKKAVSPKMVQFNPYVRIEEEEHDMNTIKIDTNYKSAESPKQVSFSPIVEFIDNDAETETEIKDDEITNLLNSMNISSPKSKKRLKLSTEVSKRKLKFESVSDIQQKAIETTKKVINSLMNNDDILTSELTIELELIQKRLDNLGSRISNQNKVYSTARFKPLEAGTPQEEDHLLKIAILHEKLKYREERLKIAEKLFEMEWNFQSESKRLFSKLNEEPITFSGTTNNLNQNYSSPLHNITSNTLINSSNNSSTNNLNNERERLDSFYIPPKEEDRFSTKMKSSKISIPKTNSYNELATNGKMQSPIITNIDTNGNRESVDPNEFIKSTSTLPDQESIIEPDADEMSNDYQASTDNDTFSDDPYNKKLMSETLSSPRTVQTNTSTTEKKIHSGNHMKLYVDMKELVPKGTQLQLQEYQCAGCSTPLKDSFFSRPRYCHYTCKYYCSDCHRNETAALPAYIVHNWDFTGYYVCSNAKSYLKEIATMPMICVSAANPSLFDKVPNLQKARMIRQRLMIEWDILVDCPNHNALVEKYKLNAYMNYMTNTEIYSIQNLEHLNFEPQVSPFLKRLSKLFSIFSDHISKQCKYCKSKSGIICSVCYDPNPIYAFNLSTVTQCSQCNLTFHKDCFKDSEKKFGCPKCDK
eukprot:gene10483-3005_t